MRLGVDPRKADQMVRGTVNLPHGTGKTARVIVFATGEKAAEAEAAGADVVGGDDLIDGSRRASSTSTPPSRPPTRWARSASIARILGPRGLMPNPKTGTVTADVTKAVSDIKGGKINFRVDKQANLHLVIGKVSFDEKQLVENYAAALDEISRAKPATAKGTYLKKITFTHDHGPRHPGRPQPHPQPDRRRARRRARRLPPATTRASGAARDGTAAQPSYSPQPKTAGRRCSPQRSKAPLRAGGPRR